MLGLSRIAAATYEKSSTFIVNRCLADTIDTLHLFNKKADKLNRLGFTSFVRNNNLTFSASSRDGQVTFAAVEPSEDETDAFLLTLRFFIQDNESISIRNMAKLYSSPPLSTVLVTAMRKGRNDFNTFLNASSGFVWKSENLTNHRVFEVFLYGGLAHANPSKKREWDAWCAEEHLGILKLVFLNTVVEHLNFILWLQNKNTMALKELETTGDPLTSGI
jgi:hypothetical protein